MKGHIMSKENKLQKAIKLEDKPKKSKKNNLKQGTIGVLELFVVASAIYAIAVIAMGTEGYIPLVMVVPLALWVVFTLLKRFTN